MTVLVGFNIICLGIALYFMFESIRERERRAPLFGLAGAVFHGVLFPIIIFIPQSRLPVLVLFSVYVIVLLVCLVPLRAKAKRSEDYVVGDVKPFDERTTVFRSHHLEPGTERAKEFYKEYPEFEEYDRKRREVGEWSLGPAGKIDSYYPPTQSMTHATFDTAVSFGSFFDAKPQENTEPFKMDPDRASEVVKKFARHLGADLVGITKFDPRWAYSIRGEAIYPDQEEYGMELNNTLPYVIVFATEMNYEHVMSAPHTPLVAESGANYVKGVYISTILARWFANMGYNASAQNYGHFDAIYPPLAVDAGIGELARNGYIITDRFGPRVRLAGVFTDMPLALDSPISLGVDKFCETCRKCATSCPSNAIPEGDRTVRNGVEKWNLNDENCYMLWGKFGTDCAICMSICPYSRPNTPIHRVVRWMVKNSSVARSLFPHIDNMIYGKRWKPKKTSSWLARPKNFIQ